MKTTSLIVTLGAALLLAQAATTVAQKTWQTVADFQCERFTAVDALTKDAAGNLYAAVASSDADGRTHAQVRKSSDRGTTWTVVEDLVSAVAGSTKFFSLGADTAGHLFAVGHTSDEENQTRWIVRKSSNGGNSWSTVDDFAGPGGQEATAHAFAADATGNLYVAGFGDESPSEGKSGWRTHWLVRQSRDGGRSWATIDDFSYSFSARAAAIVSTSHGLFVAGSGWNDKPESGQRWLVRKGTVDDAGGTRWQTVDEFQFEENKNGYDSRPSGLAVDALGNLYVVGRGYVLVDGAIIPHWIVRRASRAGSDWTVVDTFQLHPGHFAAARGVAASAQGGVYVVGQAQARDFSTHWIVRKSATGEAGSWSINDDFRPSEISGGLCILSDSTHVFAGGWSHGELKHAMVRRVELSRTNDLSVARVH
jgi:hypothetical protein